ncbi:MAG: enoyl-CoA hydratase-related protein, partial [Ruminococcus flavefaciens]|nr:enoyl-CoA hydratase-related protein [Ruminococcus flavefaciens]
VRLLGKEKALQMCLCGEIMTAQQALEIGLVTKITEQKNALGETAEFLDELLKGKSDLQIRAITETVNRTIRGDSDPSGNSFADVLKEVQSR